MKNNNFGDQQNRIHAMLSDLCYSIQNTIDAYTKLTSVRDSKTKKMLDKCEQNSGDYFDFNKALISRIGSGSKSLVNSFIANVARKDIMNSNYKSSVILNNLYSDYHYYNDLDKKVLEANSIVRLNVLMKVFLINILMKL